MNASAFASHPLLLPNGYELVRLGYVARLQNGLTVDAKRDVTGDVVTRPYLRVANVQAGSLDLDSVTEITVPRSVARRSTLRPGDVLMTEGGDLDKLGRGTVWEGELDSCLHQNHIFAIRPDPRRLSGKFLAYVTQSLYGRSYFESTGTRTTNLASTNSSKIQSFPLPLPPLKEQRRIADFLDAETARIDSLIDARDRQLEKLKERWSSGLAAQVEQLISDHGLISLRRVIRSVEQGWSPQCEDAIATPDEWAVLKTSAVSSGAFRPLEQKRLPGELRPDVRYQLGDGDLLMTRGSGSPEYVGVPAVVRAEGRKLLLSDLLYRIRTDKGWNSDFVALMLKSSPVRGFMSLLFRGQSGQTIKLRAEDIKAIEVPDAPVDQQERLTKKLSAEERKIEDVRGVIARSSALLAERRQALITAAVTGQLDVATVGQTDVA
ncbi:restriction endonuclease subunit S [Streptomyces sp. NPDC012389]|uniref:restriction endonuclease subunit S n=1 Tax=Streptomyces sp. NPDC012389 TaxID=3364830 RepID=UPI0036E5B7A7